jgi:hypothetical protein
MNRAGTHIEGRRARESRQVERPGKGRGPGRCSQPRRPGPKRSRVTMVAPRTDLDRETQHMETRPIGSLEVTVVGLGKQLRCLHRRNRRPGGGRRRPAAVGISRRVKGCGSNKVAKRRPFVRRAFVGTRFRKNVTLGQERRLRWSTASATKVHAKKDQTVNSKRASANGPRRVDPGSPKTSSQPTDPGYWAATSPAVGAIRFPTA